MSYVYVYIYTLYTGAKVCVYVYAVSEERARVQYRRRYRDISLAAINRCTRRERMSKKKRKMKKQRRRDSNFRPKFVNVSFDRHLLSRMPYCTYAMHYAYYLYLHASKTKKKERVIREIGDRLCIS